MEPEQLAVHLFRICLSTYAVGGVSSFALTRFPRISSLVGFSAAWVGGLAGCLASLACLSQGTSPALTLFPTALPFVRFSVQLDPLAAFFTLVISLLGVAISIYSYGYVTHYFGVKNVGSLAGFFNLLLLATTLIFCADNAVFLLIAWELMALFAFVLVVFEQEYPETRRAGQLYFVMSHIGVGCLILGFLLLFQVHGSFRFEDLHHIGAQLSLSQRTAAFLLFFAGFGIKAGVIPLHIWLPAAHPVAPSNISAFMSGVLIKTGIYGMVRVFFDFLAPPPVSWGLLILTAGSASALLGVLYALVEHDLKRLLAFHSIENIGIILMGLGSLVTLHLVRSPRPCRAGFGRGPLSHVESCLLQRSPVLGRRSGAARHGNQKHGRIGRVDSPSPVDLLLLPAGSCSHLRTSSAEWVHQRVVDLPGTSPGLWRHPDRCAADFPDQRGLVGSYRRLGSSLFCQSGGDHLSIIAAKPSGRKSPRGAGFDASRHGDSRTGLRGARRVSDAVPPVVGSGHPAVSGANNQLPTDRREWLDPDSLWGLNGDRSQHQGSLHCFSRCCPCLSFCGWSSARRGRHRVDETWDCGLDRLTPEMEYTATAYSKPLRMIFQSIYRPRRRIQADFGVSRYFTKSIRFESHIEPTFEQLIYRPVNRAILRFSRRVRLIQTGNLTTYLVYIFLTLIALLLWEKIQYDTGDLREALPWF